MIKPPCIESGTGRRLAELMDMYTDHLTNTPNKYTCISDTICVSKLSNMSLNEYITAASEYCRIKHTSPCKRCSPLITSARIIQDRGICELSHVFREAFPTVTYTSQAAKQRLLQIPVAAIRCGNPASGKSKVFLMEVIPGGSDIYQKGIDFYLQGTQQAQLNIGTPSMTKDDLKNLLCLAQSDGERECIKYAVFKSSGLTPTAARKFYGFQDVTKRIEKVEQALSEALHIRKAIQDLAEMKDKAILLSQGIDLPESCSSSEDLESDDSCNDSPIPHFLVPQTEESNEVTCTLTPIPQLKEIVTRSKSNFFQITEEVESIMEKSLSSEELNVLFWEVLSLPESSYDSYLIHQSYRALIASSAESLPDSNVVELVNGNIITDSESDDPEKWLLAAVSKEEKIEMITKQRATLKRKMQRERAKCIASKKFLSRKVSSKVRGLVSKFPNIGKDIEKFVSERGVGADHWRRTGVLTFDGN